MNDFFYAVNDLLKRWKDVWNNFATRYNMYNLTSQTNENSSMFINIISCLT